MPPVTCPFFVIAGPTAVGKSALAVTVAELCNGEIVGADAFQIYLGLDILTAKPPAEMRARAPHHLIGEVPLAHAFDVAQYLDLARRRMAEIGARGRLPVVVGGTGLYLRALLRGLDILPAADTELRQRLENEPLPVLRRRLAALDPLGAAQIDLQNPRRVIRALEVCELTGRPFSSFRKQWTAAPETVRGVVLTLDRSVLNARIEERTEGMFAAGAIEEVRTTDELGPTARQTIGVREIRAHLAGQLSRAECLARIQHLTRQYAKRQVTWFRREPALEAVDITETKDWRGLAEGLALRAAG